MIFVTILIFIRDNRYIILLLVFFKGIERLYRSNAPTVMKFLSVIHMYKEMLQKIFQTNRMTNFHFIEKIQK